MCEGLLYLPLGPSQTYLSHIFTFCEMFLAGGGVLGGEAGRNTLDILLLNSSGKSRKMTDDQGPEKSRGFSRVVLWGLGPLYMRVWCPKTTQGMSKGLPDLCLHGRQPFYLKYTKDQGPTLLTPKPLVTDKST